MGLQSINPLSSSPVRISGFHPDDPGSNPGNGNSYFAKMEAFNFFELLKDRAKKFGPSCL